MISIIASGLTAFLGPLGGPELIMIFLVLLLLVLPAVVIVALVLYLNSRKKAAGLNTPTAVRLAALEDLKAKQVISEAEYEEKRKRIIQEI